MAAKLVKSSLPTRCPYCEVNGKEVNVHFDNEGIGICPVCQNPIDANPTERAIMFDPMSSKAAWSGPTHATDVRSNDGGTAGNSESYANPGFRKVKGPADVAKRDDVSKPIVEEGYVRRMLNIFPGVTGYKAPSSHVTSVVRRTVIFRVYIPPDIERQYLSATTDSLCVLLDPSSTHKKPIASLTKCSGSQLWKGSYIAQGNSSTFIEYCYCIHDQVNNQVIKECGLKIGHRIEQISLTEDHAVTLYDGTAAFKKAASDKTQPSKLYEDDIVNGFKAMQPNWIEELRTEDRHKAQFGDLLKWVDRILNSKRPFLFVPCDASLVEQCLKDWVKQDIKCHLKLLKEDGPPKLKPEQLFLSMMGLIYRANPSLDVSEKEIIKKLNKLVGRTMESIGDKIKHWKAWMDRSIEKQRQLSLVTYLEKVISKMVDDFPEGNWPYLLPFQHYMRGYLVEVEQVEEKKLLPLAFPDKIKPIRKQKEPSNWDDRLEPFMADDPLLSYSVMQLMNDELFQQFLVGYSEGKTKGNRLGAVLLRAKDLLENQDFVAKEYTYGVIQKFLIRRKDWESSKLGIHWNSLPGLAKDLLNCFQIKSDKKKPHKGDKKRIFSWTQVQAATDVYLTILSIYKAHSETPEPAGTELQKGLSNLWRFTENIVPFESQAQYYWGTCGTDTADDLTLQLWENLSVVSDACQCFHKQWSAEWKWKFKEILNKMNAEEVAKSYSQSTNVLYMDECARYFLLDTKWKEYQQVIENLRKFTEKVLEHDLNYSAEEDPVTTTSKLQKHVDLFIDILTFCETHRPFRKYEEILAHAKSAVDTVVKSVCEGECKVENLHLLKSEDNSFKKLAKAVVPQRTDFEMSLRDSELEIDQYNQFHSEMQNKHGRAPRQLEQSMSLAELYKAVDPGGNGREVVQRYHSYKRVPIFQDLLRKEVAKPSSISECVQIAYLFTKNQLESISNGNILLSDLKELCTEHYQKDVGKLKHQLHVLNIKPHPHLVKRCLEIAAQSDKARTLLQLIEIFGLNGDFADIKKVEQKKTEVLKLGNADARFLNLCSSLEAEEVVTNISEEDRRCLETFQKCETFAQWVAANVDESAITTYVHITRDRYIFTADQTAKSSDLLSVLTGYAPLLYHLDDCDDDPIQIHRLCRLVWENRKENPELADQLLRCNSNQSVLEGVGNDMCRSGTEVQKINDTGVYEIEFPERVSVNMTAYDVIKLTLTEEPTNEVEEAAEAVLEGSKREVAKERLPKVSKSLEELEDLESRLALVGDGDSNKDTFETFKLLKDEVKRLAQAQLKLIRDGCMLFEGMRIVVYCNPTEQRPAIEVHFMFIHEQIVGWKTEQKTSLQHCQGLHGYMKACIEEWNAEIKKERRNWAELNLYTKAQLVTLRKALGNLDQTQAESYYQEALPLLEMLHSLDLGKLISTIETCKDPLSTDDIPNNEALTEVQEENFRILKEDFFSHKDDDDIRNAVRTLGDESVYDIGLDVYNDYFERVQLSRDKSTEEFSETLKAKIQETEGAELQSRLEELWKLLKVHTSNSIKGFLSLQHLGRVLQKLKGSVQKLERPRNLPQWLHRGKPALLGVPSAQTSRFVLTLYSADDSLAYPTRNEVLVCNGQTSREEVELLITRALTDIDSCYCMVNCQLLDYDVCQMIDGKLSNAEESSYAIAFIYDEDWKKCCIKTCLEKFHTKVYEEIMNDEELRTNIEGRILCTSDDIASCWDQDRHFVRLLSSKQAGVGKTFECQQQLKKVKAVDKHVKSLTISLHKSVDTDSIVERLVMGLPRDECFIHIDIAPEVTADVDELLFNLLILKSLPHSDGRIWQAKKTHYYLIECTIGRFVPELLGFLRATKCISPEEVSQRYGKEIREEAVVNDNFSVDVVAQNGVIHEKKENFLGFHESIVFDPSWQQVMNHLSWYEGDATFYKPGENKIGFQKEKEGYSMKEYLKENLDLLIKHCGCKNPTWAELANFVKFLSFQLSYLQNFQHFPTQGISDRLPRIVRFLINFLVGMAQDFATRSTKISEKNSELLETMATSFGKPVSLAKEWEQLDYPYLFFKDDGETFTTLGVWPNQIQTDQDQIHLWRRREEDVADRYTIDSKLYHPLKDQGLLPKMGEEDFKENDADPVARKQNCQKLREIMVAQTSSQTDLGISDFDPDPNYVLTKDNAKKILAIYTRFITNLPVVIMGETGCGKTKLIEFMVRLQLPTGLGDLELLKVVKVHGGTTKEQIMEKVKEAFTLEKTNNQEVKEFAKANDMQKVPLIYTVLFFDEANTTEDIGLIKEIMCDHRMNGDPLPTQTTLRFIAACNPHKSLSDEMLKKIKSGGLGSRKKGKEKKLGDTAMKTLVYRVHPLPQSLRSLVWDFGKLPADKDMSKNVELKYIRGIVSRMQISDSDEQIKFENSEVERKITELITQAQLFMRERPDECSFVSLRDVERLLVISNWFYKQRKYLFPKIDEQDPLQGKPKDSLRSIMLGLGVCYISRLQLDVRRKLAERLGDKIDEIMLNPTVLGAHCLIYQIESCETVFANEVIGNTESTETSVPGLNPRAFQTFGKGEQSTTDPIKMSSASGIAGSTTHIHRSNSGNDVSAKPKHHHTNSNPEGSPLIMHKLSKKPRSAYQHHSMIAQSRALRENLLMMVACVDTRIPLFVIGKPGTSKSLANGLVERSMKGESSKSELFKGLKFMFQESFQCSQHTTPKQIEEAYQQSLMYQTRHKPDRFVSVVLLDEIGLAEDSESNPLKTLHPLLESSCYGDKESEGKCGFIGISNWALDPAKMNRGLYLHVSPPDDHDLTLFAGGILHPLGDRVKRYSSSFAKGYRAVCESFKTEEENGIEFFGLRDFYSFIKMVAHLADGSKSLTLQCLKYSIKRNFDGIRSGNSEPVQVFIENMKQTPKELEDSQNFPTDDADILKSSLFGKETGKLLTRYVMILCENFSILSVILHLFVNEEKANKQEQQRQAGPVTSDKEFRVPEVIFGSAFRDDISYSQVCRNVYKIRMCMARGQTVIVLNIDDLHECLYDLLNQSFYEWGKRRFVNLGIGIHRVPAEVHDDFRLILIAGKSRVYSEFPIPLINRLEKHYISAATFLDSNQRDNEAKLERWMSAFERQSEDAHCQYFEDTNIATSFIGHSPEMSALVIHKATATVYREILDVTYEDHLDKIFECAKRLMLQCATAESVLRLVNTKLEREQAEEIQRIYVEEQKHENLLVYLEDEFFKTQDGPLLIQVTTFAELMNQDHIGKLEKGLNGDEQRGQFEVKNVFLAKYSHEHMFRDEVRRFYSTKSDATKVFIVQCEQANEYTNMLDSARYILQKEHNVDSAHTVLLLSLARGQSFTSYQGGAWICTHIDDPRLHSYALPPLSKCMKMKPYQLIEVDDRFIHRNADCQVEPMVDDEEDDENANKSRPSKVFPDLPVFVKHVCLSAAMSIIECHRDNGCDRVADLSAILTTRLDFYNIFMSHVRRLLKESGGVEHDDDWIKGKTADASKMNRAETLRNAMLDTLEQEFRPAIAAVIAFIDPHRNIKLLEQEAEHTVTLWLDIFSISAEIGLRFKQGLPRWFKMFHVGDENTMNFKTSFPFSWKVKEALDKLMEVHTSSDVSSASILVERFEQKPIGQLLKEISSHNKAELLKSYLDDFIYLSHPFQPSSTEHKIIQHTLTDYLQSEFHEGYGIPHIHIAYDHFKLQLRNMASMLQLSPSIAMDVLDKVTDGPIEQNLDRIALDKLSQHLTGANLDIMLKKSPELWILHVDVCKSFTETILGTKSDDHPASASKKSIWSKLEFKKLYVKHVIVPTQSSKYEQMAIVLKDIGTEYQVEAEFNKVVKALIKTLNLSASAVKFNPSKGAAHENFKRGTNEFFAAFTSSELVFPPEECPEMGVLVWLSTHITFQGGEGFDLKASESREEHAGCVSQVNISLLKRYFDCLDSQTMKDHLDSVLVGLQQRCSSTEVCLLTVETILKCYKNWQKISPQSTESPDIAEMVEKYPTMSEDLRTPSLKAMEELVALQSLVLSSVDKIYQGSGTDTNILSQMEKLLSAAEVDGHSQFVGLAIHKLLHLYGESFTVDFIKSAARKLREEMEQDFTEFSIPDIFELFGHDSYQNSKNQFIELIQEHSSTGKVPERAKINVKAILQAIFTRFIWKPETSEPISRQMCASFITAMTELPAHTRHFVRRLLTKDTWPREMNAQSTKGLHLSMLVVHTYTSMAFLENGHVAFPFTEMITNPKETVKRLLPTMPDGPLDVLLRKCGFDRDEYGRLEPSLFCICASGHPYIIQQRKSANENQRCHTCQAVSRKDPDSGKMIYSTKLKDQEIEVRKSKTGHILGKANENGENGGVRDLSPLSCAVIRCLTHLSMLTSHLLYSETKFQMVDLFRPRLTDDETTPFLATHIWTDLQQIALNCEESIDHCILLLHQILHELSGDCSQHRGRKLDTVKSRRRWENTINTAYIKKIFEKKDETIEEMKKRMKMHERLQCRERLESLIPTTLHGIDSENLLMQPLLWKYQPNATLKQMLHKLKTTSQNYAPYKALVDNCDTLIALKHLPDIIEFIKLISDKFHGQLSRGKAAEVKIREFIVKHADTFQVPQSRLMELVDSYVTACRRCMDSANLGLADVAAISEDPPVSEFLLDKYNMLTSRPLNLICCLVEAHNAVVSKVAADDNITKKSITRSDADSKKLRIVEINGYEVPSTLAKYIAREKLPLHEVTAYHLVEVKSREAIRQLLPAQSETAHSETDGSARKESAVSEFVGKRRPVAMNIEALPFFKFKEDFELWKQLELLKYKQERLPENLQKCIMALVNMSNRSLSKEIKELENLINHLSVMPRYEHEQELSKLTAEICMETPNYVNQDGTHAKDVKVKHVLHIWLMLKYAQTDTLMGHHQLQNPFDDIHDDYLKKEKDETKAIEEEFEYQNSVTKEFLVYLFEFITLRLNKGMAGYDENKEMPLDQLGLALNAFMQKENPIGYSEIIERLPVLPKGLQVCHAAKLWKSVWKKFTYQSQN